MILVDSAGWIALVHRGDVLHSRAVKVYKELGRRKRITTDAILLETCNSFSNSSLRQLATAFMEQIEKSMEIRVLEVIEVSGKLFRKGWNLFKTYADKDWSLTDCISFIIMRERNIKEAFTSDHHFAQAGFKLLL